MRDLFLGAIFLSYLLWGLRAPFILGLGYVWVDFMNPQHVAYSFLTALPLSLIMAIAALLGFIFLEPKKDGPRLGLALWLFAIWALWATLTTIWAVVPDHAWEKWDWAFKTICFAAFLPFLIKTRIQLEALLLTITLSISSAALAGAVKTLVTGGGYQVDLGLIRGNSGLAEGSTLANLAIASIPIFIYMHKYNTFFSNRRFSFCLFYGLSAASVIASIGTFERTGLVSLAVLAVLLVPTLKHKFVYTTFLGVALLTSGYILSDKWMARMHTIGTYQSDDSAMTRIQVWSWTADYIRTHPLGGGFDLYRIDRITLPNPNGNHLDPSDTIEQVGRAFHSMWFEVLGEQGIPGLAIFLAMIATFYSSMMRTFRRARLDERLTWARSLSHYMMISLTTYLIGGSFIGIAFQPFLYDMLAAGIVLHGCVYRAMRAPRIESPAMAPGSLVTA